MIKAVIFDIGGVLVENPKFKEFWNNAEGSKELRIQFGMQTISTQEFIRLGSKILHLSEDEFYKKYKENYWTGELVKDVFEVFKSIKLKKYIFSDTNPIHKEYLKHNFNEIFEIADKSFLNKRKHFLSSYKEILEEINELPENVVFIDNNEQDINNSKKLGIHGILFKDSQTLKIDLKNLGIDIN
jgi:HAD superfamily hydrolase (TIGR01549 family)